MPKAKQKPANHTPPETTKEASLPQNKDNQDTTKKPTPESTQELAQSAPVNDNVQYYTNSSEPPKTPVAYPTTPTELAIQNANNEVNRLHKQLNAITDQELLLKSALQKLKEQHGALEEELLSHIKFLQAAYAPQMQTLLF